MKNNYNAYVTVYKHNKYVSHNASNPQNKDEIISAKHKSLYRIFRPENVRDKYPKLDD